MLFKNYDEIINNGIDIDTKNLRKDVLNILESSILSVEPYNCVKKHINDNSFIFEDQKINIEDFNDVYIVGFGKASIGMTQAICDNISVKRGVIITNEEKNKVINENIETILGGHPIPNENSIKGAEKIIDMLKNTKKDDLIIVLISGGGSALFCNPYVELKDLQVTTDLLLKSGANINEINTIRKHLSKVKGGRLVSYTKSRIISLIISDIIGDPISFIASGPTYPDDTSFFDSKKILEKYDIYEQVPKDVKKILNDGINKKIEETPKSGDNIFCNVDNFIVANNNIACKFAEKKAKKLGYNTMVLTTRLSGEAKNTGRFLIEKSKNFEKNNEKYVFISGGETTVTIKGNGLGGRNQEMILSIIEDISDENIVFASIGTDGIDGKSNAAGAIADKNSYYRSKERNLDYKYFLENNDSNSFFRELGDVFLTGPTGTNVMDIQIIIIY